MTTELAPAETPLAILGQMDLKAIDPEKVEKLLSLQERWEDRQAEKAYAAAVVAFQAEMPPVHKGREVQGKYSYASYDDIMKIARPILQAHGLAVSFSQVESGEMITLTVRITHAAGHSEDFPITMPKLGAIQTRDGRDVTNAAQAMGSANMYARRYGLCNALDIVVTDEDDDATAAGAGPKVDPETAERLDGLLAELSALDDKAPARALKFFGVADIAELPAAKAGEAEDLIKKKINSLAK